MTKDSPRLAADQLRHVRVFLLRHHRAAGAVSVRQFNESKLLTRPQDQLLRKATQMHEQNRRHGNELENEVAIADRVDTVLKPWKVEQLGDVVAIDGEAGSRQGAGAERSTLTPETARNRSRSRSNIS